MESADALAKHFDRTHACGREGEPAPAASRNTESHSKKYLDTPQMPPRLTKDFRGASPAGAHSCPGNQRGRLRRQ